LNWEPFYTAYRLGELICLELQISGGVPHLDLPRLAQWQSQEFRH
jgi:hypothetical protein